MGYYRFSCEWDWDGAEAAYRRAIELNPNSVKAHLSFGLFLIYMGRFDEGVPHCETARRLDPNSLETNIWLAFGYGVARRADESIAQLEFIRELDPSWQAIHHCIGIAYAWKGMWNEAVASCDRYAGAHPTFEYCGTVYGLAGLREKALARFEFCSTESDVNPMCMAGIHAALGETDEAMVWLETAYEQRRAWLVGWMRLPLIADNLRDDPRFEDIELRMGLPEYPR